MKWYFEKNADTIGNGDIFVSRQAIYRKPQQYGILPG